MHRNFKTYHGVFSKSYTCLSNRNVLKIHMDTKLCAKMKSKGPSIDVLKVGESEITEVSKRTTTVNKKTIEMVLTSPSTTDNASPSASGKQSKTNKGTTNTEENKKKSKATGKKQTKMSKVQNLIDVTIPSIKKHQKEKEVAELIDSYMDVCGKLKMYRKAKIVQWCESVVKHRQKNVMPYVSLLRNFYLQDDIMEILETKFLLKRDNLSPNSTVYAYWLAAHHLCEDLFKDVNVVQILTKGYHNYSIGQLYYACGDNKRSELITKHIIEVLEDMQNKGISIDKMFLEVEFVRNLRSVVLDAIRRVEPQYTLPAALLSSDCHTINEDQNHPLLKHLSMSPLQDWKPDEVKYGTELLADFKRDKSSSPFSVNLDDIILQLHETEYKRDVSVKSVYDGRFEQKADSWLKGKFEAWHELWRKQLSETISRRMQVLEAEESSLRPKEKTLFPFLKVLDEKTIVDAMLEEVCCVAQEHSFETPEYRLHIRLGRRLYNAYKSICVANYGVFRKKEDVYLNYCRIYEKNAGRGMQHRQVMELLSKHLSEGLRLDSSPPPWTYNMMRSIGVYLYEVIINDVKVWLPKKGGKVTERPALIRQEMSSPTKYYMCAIVPHPVFIKAYRLNKDLKFTPNELPMVTPALPWTSPSAGGYCLVPSELVRVMIDLNKLFGRKGSDLRGVMDAMNVLGSIPWRVNAPVLDVILELFQSSTGGDIGVSAHPATLPHVDEKDKGTYIEDQYHKTWNEMNSLWCTALYKLSVANHFRDKVLWFPHNMDFRGRAYPIQPYLSHVDSDVFRSLLLFAEKKPLGEKGLKWLKTHIINLTGFCKLRSLNERLNYCDEVLPLILDSANNPLTGQRWWTQSDEPFQTLAACMELRDALASPDPTAFMSCLPIHQDGSCNGLQHYAALGRDIEGANSVNLTPNNVPQDVYSEVAAIVDQMRAKDAANGNPIAKSLEGLIQRKVVKQTVMTVVYGVTGYGALAQVEKQLKEIEDFPRESLKPASRYVANAIFASLRRMFSSARSIQDWLNDCANVITRVRGEKVRWVTPIGLPVEQPYSGKISVNKLSSLPSAALNKAVATLQFPKVTKQRNALAPNFVHSLDATHMMLTAISCNVEGITFSSIHDCYWTHACSVDRMSEICRDQFVKLYSQPILDNLSQQFMDQYCFSKDNFKHDGSKQDSRMHTLHQTFQAVPELGKFNIEEVRKSTFFFS